MFVQKSNHISLILTIFISLQSYSQNTVDPFFNQYILGNSAELYITNGNIYSDDAEYDENMYDFETDGKIKSETYTTQRDEYYHGGTIYSMDAISGLFNGSPYGYDEVISVKTGMYSDSTFFMDLDLNYKNKYQSIINSRNLLNYHDNICRCDCRLEPAQLDNDPYQEFIYSFRYCSSNQVGMYFYDISDSLGLNMLYVKYYLFPNLGESKAYDICAGDFDSDDLDEIVIIGNMSRPEMKGSDLFKIDFKMDLIEQDSYNNGIRTYKSVLFRQDSLFGKTKHPINNTLSNIISLPSLTLSSGDIDNDDCSELIMGFELIYSCDWIDWERRHSDRTSAKYLVPIEIGDKNGISRKPDYPNNLLLIEDYPVDRSHLLWIFKTPTNLWCGDIDQDGYLNDIAFQGIKNIHIGNIVPNPSEDGSKGYFWDEKISIPLNPKIYEWPENIIYSSDDLHFYHKNFEIKDVNATESSGDWQKELIVTDFENSFSEQLASNYAGRLRVRSYQLTNSEGILNSPRLLYQIYLNENITYRRMNHSIMTTGDYDGDAIKIGTPRRITLNSVMETVCIINSPPVHFDILDNKTYDICNAFNDHENLFTVTFGKEDTEKEELITRYNKNWSLSTALKTEVAGLNISSKLSAKYGKNFSKSNEKSEQTTINVTTELKDDGLIIASLTDYEFLEYPVFANHTFKGNILVTIPDYKGLVWFPMKNDRAASYIPNHEYGNLFSYDDDFKDNKDVAIRIDNTENTFIMDATSQLTYDWKLTSENISSESSTSTGIFSSGLSFDASIPLKIIKFNVELNGSFSREDITTRSSSVSDKIEIDLHFDKLNPSYGQVNYEVTPYVYWSYSGAFVLDYLVNLNPVSSSDSWWADMNNYGMYPDLSFIMPWRLDKEKGKFLYDPYKVYHSNDIQIYPSQPDPGDTVRIEARIHNFSMKPFDDHLKLRFYIGDPDKGGIQISDVNGDSEWNEHVLIDYQNESPYRKYITAKLNWKIPSDIIKDPKIFVVIDPDNEVDEIHRENNKAFQQLKIDGIVSTENTIYQANSYNMYNYPNPCNERTFISFELKEAGSATLNVYNKLGQKVYQEIWGSLPIGENKIDISTSGLSSGLYIYEITSGNQKMISKMIIKK